MAHPPRGPRARLSIGLSFHQCVDVLGALAGAKLDDAKLCESVFMERILPEDGLDLFPTLGERDDDTPFTGNLPARYEEVAGRVILVQERDMLAHVRVDLGQVGGVNQFDHEHRAPLSNSSLRSTGASSGSVGTNSGSRGTWMSSRASPVMSLASRTLRSQPQNQLNRTSSRLRNPMRKRMWTPPQRSQAAKPPTSRPAIWATAFALPMIASDPLSRYTNGARSTDAGAPATRAAASRAMMRPACRPIWIPPCATPGTGLPVSLETAAAMSPTTNSSGCPGTERSGPTMTRPARSSGT